jgi:UDPglucose--hexose-1-phosphate uridylyltransferase
MKELRREPIVQRWVLISSEHPPANPKDSCPFCSGNEKDTPPEILAVRPPGGRADQWLLRVVPNVFPFFRIEGNLDRRAVGMYDEMNGIGAHELVIETPQHFQHWGTMSTEELSRVLWAYQQRFLDLRKDSRFRQVIVAKNHYSDHIRIPHQHSHIVAMPIIPKRIDEEIKGLDDYYRHKERCIFCDVLHEEIAVATRVVFESANFVAFCPYASRYPYELWVVPKNHAPDFAQISEPELKDLALNLRHVLGRLKAALHDPPYSLVVHSTPVQKFFHKGFHWHIELRPRVEERSGFEWATGFFVNFTPPEFAAKKLREAREE